MSDNAFYSPYRSCESHFLIHAQTSASVQALCVYMNIRLPCQKIPILLPTSSFAWLPPPTNLWFPSPGNPQLPHSENNNAQPSLLIPYIRRLICTGLDTEHNLKEFFGSDWFSGIGAIHGKERENYLFAAKSENWLKVKSAYDIGSEETTPFLAPLRDATEEEIIKVELKWMEWLAMQDWVIGDRRPLSLDA